MLEEVENRITETLNEITKANATMVAEMKRNDAYDEDEYIKLPDEEQPRRLAKKNKRKLILSC